MARLKKPRNKRYVPKPIVRDAAGIVLDLSHRTRMAVQNFDEPLTVGDQVQLAMSLGAAIERIARMEGDGGDMNSLISMTNLSRMLCEPRGEVPGLGAEYLNDIIEAQDALFRAKLRFQKHKKYGFDAIGLTAVRRAFDIHCAQIELAGQGHLMTAERKAHKRMTEGDYYGQAEAA